ncbi:MAG: TetR/AcrR family transcriptional regulator; helix-turn-helix transcriptional regulator [Xanthobacteraceae bacterium]|nr:TetR/AcrR family transcriptional regulator; helix-turn-helix transcriptional regulator [Xanthobacteraceae bacterium]
MARRQTAKRAAQNATREERRRPGRAPPKVPATTSAAAPARGIRAARAAERRDAILAAALEEFAVSGFAATRLDDVARRAGVAKGTIYLYFRDKESLFQELVRATLSPVVGNIETAQMRDVPARMIAEMIADIFAREIFGTRRKDVLRLIITEGARFPKIAEFYYHEVIERVVAALRAMLGRAVARGELKSDALVRFPQLLVSPALMALVWNGMFDRFAPLDIRALMRAHIEILFGDRPPQDNALQRTSS